MHFIKIQVLVALRGCFNLFAHELTKQKIKTSSKIVRIIKAYGLPETMITKERNGTSMIEITKENIWKTEYDIKRENYETKRGRKAMMIGLTLLSVVLAANLILIYTFFNLLNKI